MKILLKIVYGLVMKTSILVGGQAVIEGVMMRVPGAYATALRLKNGKIISQKFEFESIIDNKGLKKYIIIRGMIHLYESMKIGYKTLNWSATVFEEQEKTKKTSNALLINFFEYIANFISIVFAITLFYFLFFFLGLL